MMSEDKSKSKPETETETKTKLWSLTLIINEDGSRALDVDGTPSVGDMLSELHMILENLRAQLFVDKLKEEGRKPQIVRPG